ncbi:E3 ubiquitin/ISG15 ligase TRIM25 [Chanos chanos]|uniref:E3 ubiquitin/ISG15 ligase TRIM25 n=1 Tax=Chanos chanos TaxID=29144 RepID=A0A6J2USW1_CHACN|nr:E3 ubiquitin/ISG15 ligase TRIM25-like [Chanos chanos]
MSASKPEDLLAQELSCPICLQLFSDPVTLPCGHNYCMDCISAATPSDNPKSPARCPECREEYNSPDQLQRNFKLSGIVDGYRSAMEGGGLKTMEEEEQKTVVTCDQCLDGPMPAVKRCLRCEVSLCLGHLQRHEERHQSRGHVLADPIVQDPMERCQLHRKKLEFVCGLDRTFLCTTCVVEGTHQNHEILTVEAADGEMRHLLGVHAKATTDRLQMTNALLKRARSANQPSDTPTEKLVYKAESVLDNMLALVNGYKDRMKELMETEVRQREKEWQSSVYTLEDQEQLLQEAKSSAAEVLAETNEFRFIQRYLKIEARLRYAASLSVAELPANAPAGTKRLRAEMRTDEFRYEMSLLLQSLHGLLNPLDLTFNPNTAHPNLMLSNDLRTVRYNSAKQGFSENSERFTSVVQVLASQGLSRGVHVWVAELEPCTMWSLGLCYKSIARKGDHSRLGHNSSSWRLQWKNRKMTACHESVNLTVPDAPTVAPQRVEVALDYEGGTLSFHCVSGKRRHLYTFHAVFRETVYPAFSIHSTTDQSWITLLSGV